MFKKDILTTFLSKILELPVWLQKVIYMELAKNLQNKLGQDFVNDKNLFVLHNPKLTSLGRNELLAHSLGFDSNIYNFLLYCDKNATLSEISLNTFLTLEEISKIFIFCTEQNLVECPKDINLVAGFLAGKYDFGEYLLHNGILNERQLEQAVSESSKNNKKLAEILIDKKFITKQTAETLLNFKAEATTRCVLDYNTIPCYQNVYNEKVEIKQ